MLFIGAHPDDIELNCGGTVIKLIESGKKVGIADLTLAELSTLGDINLRKKETDAASKMLGISVRENLKIEDGNIEINKTNKEKIIKVIRKYKPELVFAPYPLDRHPDHINAGNLIREAFFYSGLEKIKIKNSESYRPKKLIFYRNAYEMPVSFIFDISSVHDKKIEVLKCYESQFYNPISKVSKTLISSKLFEYEIEARARHFGFKIGVEFGEPYFSYDTVKINEKNLFEI
ncbi:MAG: bacillithiol biosynthesis deacetylase BshB1 [Ignavibacteria bacterium]|nr:bacillithiol biosynthesis deacetylase BshB1 [Ignavibacteria bacterium]